MTAGPGGTPPASHSELAAPARPTLRTPERESKPERDAITMKTPSKSSRGNRNRQRRPDKDAINREALAVCGHYLGAPKRASGARASWHCPQCGKEKFEASRTGVGGCWNAACPVPTSTDAVGLIAFFEELDLKDDFGKILEKGYEILGLSDHPPRGPEKKAHRGMQATRTGKAPQTAAAALGSGPRVPDASPTAYSPEDSDLLDAVYRRLLSACRLHERDRRFLAKRGLDEATMARGRFGSTTARRTRAVVQKLAAFYGEEELLKVPGFFKNGKGNFSFTLYGDYLLIPYHDREGRVTTIEGRYAGGGDPPLGKYVSLRSSGTHLYVFPGYSPDELLAFCEGVMGAILAARSGIPVGAIKGFRNHQAAGTKGEPLPELKGADFRGRRVPYIPDADDPPKSEVLTEAPKAARNLALAQNGRPALVTLPKGMDLDEWLVSLPTKHRTKAFRRLIASAKPLGDKQEATQRSS